MCTQYYISIPQQLCFLVESPLQLQLRPFLDFVALAAVILEVQYFQTKCIVWFFGWQQYSKGTHKFSGALCCHFSLNFLRSKFCKSTLLVFLSNVSLLLAHNPATSFDTAFITWVRTAGQFMTALAIWEGIPWANALRQHSESCQPGFSSRFYWENVPVILQR